MNKKIIVILTFSEEVSEALAEDLRDLGEYTTQLLPGVVSFTIDGEKHEKEMKDIVCACKNSSLDGIFGDLQPLFFTARAHEAYCQEACLARGCPVFSTVNINIKLDGYEAFTVTHAACVCECGATPVSDEELTFRDESEIPLLPPPKETKKKSKGKKKKDDTKDETENKDSE
jgi:hypothetical protein